MQGEKRIKVMAYSGYKANERPLYVTLNGERREIRKIIERWYEQDYYCYKVLADDGYVYLLKWNRSLDIWFMSGKERSNNSV